MVYNKKDLNKYTINDLIVLRGVLRDSCPINGSEYEFSFQAKVMDSLRDTQKERNGLLEFTDVQDAIENWVVYEINGSVDSPFTPDGFWKREKDKLALIKKVLFFIFKEPLASVPLKINDKDLKAIVAWRLKIGI